MSESEMTQLLRGLQDAIRGVGEGSEAETREGDPAQIADGLFEVATAIRRAASHLGLNDASTPMGALEALGVSVEKGAGSIAESISELAAAVRDLADRLPVQ